MSSLAPTTGGTWDDVGEPLRSMQDLSRHVRGTGTFGVRWGRGTIARLFATILRLPPPSDAVDAALEVVPAAGVARWKRTFGSRTLETSQAVTSNGLLERFGCIGLELELVASHRRLQFVQRRAKLFVGPLALPLPLSLAPRVEANAECCDDGRTVRAEVDVKLPLFGTLLAYAGTMRIEVQP